MARALEMARPLMARAAAFARSLPGRARDLNERIDWPRRIDEGRRWVDRQDFPGRTRRAGVALGKAARIASAEAGKAAGAARAKAAPLLAATGSRSAAMADTAVRIIAGRSARLGAALAERRARAAARKAELTQAKAARRLAKESERDADQPPAPVPSELMRLLREEGVPVEGLDVREALPEPLRSTPQNAQGALPLFADEPPGPPASDVPPEGRPKAASLPPVQVPAARAKAQGDATEPPPPPESEKPSMAAPSRWRRMRGLTAALLASTDGQSLWQSRTFQMSVGIGTIAAAVAGAALMMQGGGPASPASGAGVALPANMDRTQLEAIIHDYILDHPEIIPEAIDRLQAKRAAATVGQYRAQLETPFAGAWEGAKDGDVVLVEFFDYACPYCKASLKDVDRLLAEDPRLKIVYRDLPILSEESGEAAKASLYAAQQGKYGRFHRALYGQGQLSKDAIERAAKQAGLDPQAMKSAEGAGDISAEIESNLRLARALQATGTPTWVVGGQILSGAVGYDALRAAIAKARADRQAG